MELNGGLGSLVSDPVVRLANVRARLVSVYGVNDQGLGRPRLLSVRQNVVLENGSKDKRVKFVYAFSVSLIFARTTFE